MAISDAQKKATRKWNEAHRSDYWRCTVMIPAEDKERVLARAADRGQSVSEYIRALIHEDIADRN